MTLRLPPPHHLPCPECGAAVELDRREDHVCDRERLLDYRMFALRDQVGAVERELEAYLESPEGRFELWCAEHDREGRS